MKTKNRINDVAVLLLAFAAAGLGQTITTVAGNSSWGAIYNVTVDGNGNLYVPDFTKHAVYKVDPSGITTMVAGTGKAGYSGDGAQATSAQLNSPLGTAVALDGTLYISDFGNHRIRKVAPNGVITTIAGSTAGFSGDGGPASAARISGPFSMARDTAGNVYFVDYNNLRIRKIAPNGIISTVAGTGKATMSGDGGPATSADSYPGWMALGPDGSIYFTDDGNSQSGGYKRIRRVAPNGRISTVAGTGVAGYTGDGGPATSAQLRSAEGVAVDAAGTIYIAEGYGNRIRKVDTTGAIYTFAGTGVAGSTGDGGDAISARLNYPSGLAVDASGNLYVADTSNVKIRKITVPRPPDAVSVTSCSMLSAFGGSTSIAPGAWIQIVGTNLAGNSRGRTNADLNGIFAPTVLDGTSVTIAGQAAFLEYISPTQINAQVPSGVAAGVQQLIVTSPAGNSAAYNVDVTDLQPGLFAPPSLTAGGNSYIAAVRADGGTPIFTPGDVFSLFAPRALPGDTVSFYGSGFGPVTPDSPAGQIVQEANSLVNPVEFSIGGSPAALVSAGLMPGSIGIYQFSVVVPTIPASDGASLTFTLRGVAGTQAVYIAIGN